MTHHTTNPKVDEFINQAKKWQAELEALRKIVLDCELAEQWKWEQPCYTLQNHNILMIAGFKDHCVLSFFKGALLRDVHGLLVKPGENTQSGRVIRFMNVLEIVEREVILKDYIHQAIELEKSGTKVAFKKVEEYVIPEEFQAKLQEDIALQTAFTALTPGRQRAYLMFFNSAKQSKSREARIEKYIPRILNGKGINDCTCGLSKKMPACDGSHKYLS
jgi:uncharacterized protein YdeI (YjbR/CyaY-like superfamily)